MLENMARNLQNLNFSSLNSMMSISSKIGSLMNQAQGITFDVNATRTAFAQNFPQQYSAAVNTGASWSPTPTSAGKNSMDAFQQTVVFRLRSPKTSRPTREPFPRL